MKENILHIAGQTIRSEAKSVLQLENNLTADFEKAVEAIYYCSGRIVVTGVGKSAIVAQKMVATFNSTGTPAVFMHAADAIHGDLGMMQKEDVMVVVSNSGNSSEIKTLLPLLKQLAQTIIAITGNLQSNLAAGAHFIINASVTEESCPHNLAPTNSTTVQMVVGDALAVCLMKLNHFKEEDFARFHPGGNIGKRLYLWVEDLYKINEKPEVLFETPVKKVINEISGKRLGCTAVINDEDKLIGIITDGDIRRMLEKTDNI
ncbi:MAG: KpsF/GutQ family sugar-phosphate isomerase, partial [Bacteroidota bacterium]|nr:KpsF/GutQ family sugar-phosphate isomerase [Bacteroidota bacterium]